MKLKTKFKKIDEILKDCWFTLWSANDNIPSAYYYGVKGAYLDSVAIKEIMKYSESISIYVENDRLCIWIRLKK